MKENPLGKAVAYPERYDPELLVPLPRADNRRKLGLDSDQLPFQGADVWNAYELSWLDPKGLPQVARGRFIFPCTSDFLIESKSLKLYLNSLNQSVFVDSDAVAACIGADLSHSSGMAVEVLVQPFAGMQEVLEVPTGTCLDALDIDCNRYEVDAALLVDGEVVGRVEVFTFEQAGEDDAFAGREVRAGDAATAVVGTFGGEHAALGVELEAVGHTTG